MPVGDKIEKLERKPQVPFTAVRKAKYIDIFRNHELFGGRKYLCAEAIGVAASTIDYHCRYDPEFAEQLEESRQAWIDENLYLPALHRATHGVSKPIIGGKFKNEVVCHVQEYSDTLMLAMLRAHKPEFKDKGDSKSGLGATGGGGVMVVPTAPANASEWEDLFGEKARGTTGQQGA